MLRHPVRGLLVGPLIAPVLYALGRLLVALGAAACWLAGRRARAEIGL